MIGRLSLVIVTLAAASACIKTQAKTPEAPPVLTIPAPPPRMHLPVDIELPPHVEPPPPTEPPATTPPKPNPQRSTSGSTAAQTPPPVTTPPPAPEQPPPVLQPSDVSQVEKEARSRLAEAQKNLSGVMLNNLRAGGRTHYYDALRFVRQAEQALAAKNFLYARVLASNAATLARLLIDK